MITQAQQQPTAQSIVLPEWQDERMLKAAEIVANTSIATPVFIGDTDAIHQRCAELGIASTGFDIRQPQAELQAQRLQKRFAATKNISDAKALALVNDSLYSAALLLHVGEVDGMVAGINRSTADMVRAAIKVIGLAAGHATASSFFIISFQQEHHAIKLDCIMADCALVIEPSVDQLADIAIASADNAIRILGVEVKIAMLSFSSQGSAKHGQVDRVQQATQKVRQLRPDLQIIGEVQVDVALVPHIAEQKMDHVPFQPPANVLIFSNLAAGNIGYKMCQRLAGGDVVGPIFQGLNKPINNLSRGSTVEDIVRVIALTALQAVG